MKEENKLYWVGVENLRDAPTGYGEDYRSYVEEGDIQREMIRWASLLRAPRDGDRVAVHQYKRGRDDDDAEEEETKDQEVRTQTQAIHPPGAKSVGQGEREAAVIKKRKWSDLTLDEQERFLWEIMRDGMRDHSSGRPGWIERAWAWMTRLFSRCASTS